MMGRFVRALALTGLCCVLVLPAGCTKRIPMEKTEFEAQQRVVLTLKDGRTLRGRIAPGQRIEYREEGSTYRAEVTAVTPDTIRLGQILLVDDGKYDAIGRRLEDGRAAVSDPVRPVSIARGDVGKVELQKFDGYRTARSLGVWVYGSAILALLLGERS